MKRNKRYSHIVVRSPNWVGDAVMATPFLASLRQTFPQAKIACLCRPVVADIFQGNPDIDSLIKLDETHGRRGRKFIRFNAAQVGQRQFDLAISLPRSLSSALIFYLAHIPERVGYRGDWRRILLTRSKFLPTKGRRPHRVEYYLQLLELISDAPCYERKLKMVVDETATAAVTAELGRLIRGTVPSFVALAPGAAQANKMWMPERFAALARRFSDDGFLVILVGGPAERELAQRVARLSGVDGIGDLTGMGSLRDTAEAIRRSAVFIGNDSGLAHVAAAVGAPSVVLSGPGDQTEVAPYNNQAVTIAKSLACKPCYKNYCWRKDKPLECLDLIEVDEVYAAAGARITGSQRGLKQEFQR